MAANDDTAESAPDDRYTATDVAEVAEAIRFQRDLYLYWREARTAHELPLTTRGYVTRPALRRIRARLAAADGTPLGEAETPEGEDIRILYLRRLLERLGLLRKRKDELYLVAAEVSEMQRYLDHTLAERLRICVRLWVAGGWWPDTPDSRVVPPRLLMPAPPRVALARRTLLHTLACMPSGEEGVLPQRLDERSDKRRVRSQGRASRRSLSVPLHSPSPPPSENATLRAALLGPLAWMGFVLLKESAGAAIYRVSAACAAIESETAEAAATALPERHGQVAALPNFSLIAYPPLTASLLLALDTWADEEALDQTARYQLNRAAVARAQLSGLSIPAIAEKITSLTGAPLPGNVRVSLEDWGRHIARVRLTRETTLLEVEQTALLDALLADRSATGWVARRLTPTAALIAADAIPQVRAWLLRHGQIPALTHSEPDA